MTADQMKISDILRATANNSIDLFMQIAEHIDKLESENAALRERVAELENAKE